MLYHSEFVTEYFHVDSPHLVDSLHAVCKVWCFFSVGLLGVMCNCGGAVYISVCTCRVCVGGGGGVCVCVCVCVWVCVCV